MTRKGAEITKKVKSTLSKAKTRTRAADKRLANPAARNVVEKPRGQQQDAQRRLGDFGGAGEHPRQTTRMTGNYAKSKKANTGTKRA